MKSNATLPFPLYARRLSQANDTELLADEVTLENLMERYQAADAEAVTELIDRLSPDLMRFFLAQWSSRAHADDLLQETWLRIHRARHTYRPGAPVLPWVFAIARHVRVDAFRKRFRIEKNETATDVLPDWPQDPRPAREQPIAFDRLMAHLPDSQREVVTLLKVNGLSLEEVARVTLTSVGAVKQKASRAYAKLRTVLAEQKQ